MEMNHETDGAAHSLHGRDFMLYWKMRSIVAAAAAGRPLDVVSSRQLDRVHPGDRIWVVTVDGDGRLILSGLLTVGRIVDRQRAIEVLGDSNLWDGTLYALAAEDVPMEPIEVLDINHLVPDMRFGPDGSVRIGADRDRIDTRDLQTMLEMTPETAEIFADAWWLEVLDHMANGEDDLEADEDGDQSEADAEEAREFIARASEDLRLNPNDAELLYLLGVAHARIGDREREMEFYNRALLVDPDHQAARFDLGCAYSDIGETAKARDEFSIAAESNTPYAPAHFMLGTMEGRLGNTEAAIRAFRNGLEIDAGDGGAYINLSEIYMLEGRFAEALAAIERGCTLMPENADAFFILGTCHKELGNKQAALDAFIEATNLDFMVLDHLFAAGTAWAHLHGGEEGSEIEYRMCGPVFELKDPLTQFHYALGLIAIGEVDDARNIVGELRELGSDLSERLARLVAAADRGR